MQPCHAGHSSSRGADRIIGWHVGGGVQGGRVHGEWPGLDRAALHEGRDLAITTDFRAVIAQVLAHHMRLDDRQIARVLPQGASTAGRSTLFAG